MTDGVDGLLRDNTRRPGKPPIAASIVAEIIEKTLQETPPDATHWTVRDMAKAMRISVSTVQKIWRAHGLAPHRIRQFKLSNDVAFVDKLQDVVGLYVNPAGSRDGAVDR